MGRFSNRNLITSNPHADREVHPCLNLPFYELMGAEPRCGFAFSGCQHENMTVGRGMSFNEFQVDNHVLGSMKSGLFQLKYRFMLSLPDGHPSFGLRDLWSEIPIHHIIKGDSDKYAVE